MLVDEIRRKEVIHKGWSSDQKFKVELADGRLACLRLAPATDFQRKQREMAVLDQLSARGLPVSKPLEIGLVDDQVYQLLDWVEGQDFLDRLPSLSPQALYDFGRQAGEVLLSIHALPMDQDQMDWEVFYQEKIENKLVAYQSCGLSYEEGQCMIDFVQQNRGAIANRPIAQQHGDFHIGNFLLGPDKDLVVIDFDRLDRGDPWEEFNRLVFVAARSPEMASGILDAYFKEGIPHAFWRLLCLYMTVNSLGALAWAKEVDPAQIPFMQEQARTILDWYGHYTRLIPSWYRGT